MQGLEANLENLRRAGLVVAGVLEGQQDERLLGLSHLRADGQSDDIRIGLGLFDWAINALIPEAFLKASSRRGFQARHLGPKAEATVLIPEIMIFSPLQVGGETGRQVIFGGEANVVPQTGNVHPGPGSVANR